MLGRRLAPALRRGDFTVDNSIEEMKDFSLVMKLVYRGVEGKQAKPSAGRKTTRSRVPHDDGSSPARRRSLVILAAWLENMMLGLLDMANGRFFRGLGRIFMAESVIDPRLGVPASGSCSGSDRTRTLTGRPVRAKTARLHAGYEQCTWRSDGCLSVCTADCGVVQATCRTVNQYCRRIIRSGHLPDDSAASSQRHN